MKIGFIGLGRMGHHVASNLLKAGHSVTVWNRSPEPVAALVAKGAVAAWKLGVIGKYQDKFLAEGEITREAILAWAKTAGVDVAKFTAELDAPATEQLVKRDVALAKALGVYGTPSFVVNGQLMQGGQTAQIWEKRVAEETTRADGLLSTGTRREDLIKAMVAVTNAKGLKDYEKYVLNGEPAPEAPVPAKVARNSGVASATIQPAGGGTQGLQVRLRRPRYESTHDERGLDHGAGLVAVNEI